MAIATDQRIGGGSRGIQENGTLGPHLITLYTRILRKLRDQPRWSQETLSRQLNTTMRTVQRHLTELEEIGVIAVDRDKKPFTYEVKLDAEIDGVVIGDAVELV